MAGLGLFLTSSPREIPGAWGCPSVPRALLLVGHWEKRWDRSYHPGPPKDNTCSQIQETCGPYGTLAKSSGRNCVHRTEMNEGPGPKAWRGEC